MKNDVLKFICSILFLVGVSTFGIAQNELLGQKIDFEVKNKPVPDVLRLLKEQTAIPFTYSNSVLPKDKLITLKVQQKTVKAILQIILKETEVTFKPVGNKVVLFRKNPSTSSLPPSKTSSLTSSKESKAEKYTISGYIKETESGEGLIGASIFEPQSGIGTSTNVYGFYSLTLPAGDYELQLTYIGFETQQYAVQLNKNISYNAQLSTGVALQAVEIVASKVTENIEEKTQMSTLNVPISQIKALPSLGGEVDILRSLQLLPGVQGNEASAGLSVRGGAHDQNLILLDGVPVYNSSHLFGFLSVFNADAINHVELIKGGFPARYGGRLSSVLDIRMKEGNMHKFKAKGTISPLATKLTIEAPIIKDKMSFMVSGRRTFADLFMRPITRKQRAKEGIIGETGYSFYDLNAKVNYKVSNKDRLYLSYYGGSDKYDDTANESFSTIENTFESEELIKFDWGNKIGSFRWNHLFNNKLFGNLTFYLSDYNFHLEQDSQLKNTNEGSTQRNFSNYNSGVNDKGVRLDFDYVPSPNHYIRWGVNAIRHSFTPGVNQILQSEENSESGDTVLNNFLMKSWEYAAYLEDDIKIGANFSANIGVHFSQFSVEDEDYQSIQPRLSLRYMLPNQWSVKGAFSTMSQPLHLLTNSGVGLPTDLWISPTKEIAPQRSWQAAFGTAHTFKNGIEFSVETYYKKLSDLVTYKEGTSFLLNNEGIADKVTSGQGTSYGAEFLLQKKAGKTTGWIGYTWSHSTRQFDEVNFGKKYPFKYDRRHDFSFSAVHELTKKIRLSANWVFSTGNALTIPIRNFDVNETLEANSGNIIADAIDYGSKNGFRLPSYHRLDVGISFHKKTRWGKQSFDISLYNAYNRSNPFFVKRKADLNTNFRSTLVQQSLFPIIPSVSYNFEF